MPPPPSGYEATPGGGPRHAGGPSYAGGPTYAGGPGYAAGFPYPGQPSGPACGAPAAGGPAHGGPAYGAPAYGGQTYGGPTYGASTPPYAAQPWASPPPVDGFAIGSLVTSLVGLVTFGLTSVVGVVLGFVALGRTRRRGTRGRGLAVAGIVSGFVVLLLVAAGIVAAVVFAARTSGPSLDGGFTGAPWDDGATAEEILPDYTLRTDLAPGACLLGAFDAYDLDDVETVDCAEPHDAEIVTLLPMDAPVSLSLEDYDPVFDDLASTCEADVESAAPGVQSDDLWADVYYPHPDEWDAGGRQSYCVLLSIGTDLEGSAVAGDLVPPGGSTT
ncbi:DUF4190 domain-containing protein [Cellulomonas marina]|uniref:Septum formation n=1 Tax=Cellulomonas marina TaxID=988821 RepID=A0A1I0Z2E1_9CELL|nr:DUF4190 domain-containing protein [Cellulomonas marina]SFB18443.1 Septum formation [Cellulomonas marina]